MAEDLEGAPVRVGLRNLRYGEVLLLRAVDGRFEAEVWNTMGMNDCPQDAWDELDAEAIAADRGALLALLNGPRYWVLDYITANIRAEAPETTFGRLGMFRAAVVDFGTTPPTPGPWVERSILRETVFGFDAGREIYELVAPDGTTYVMQAYSRAVDGALSFEDLAGLGGRLALPDGWTYRVRTLTEELPLLSTDGVATVLQDDLQNTYQRVDPR
jgi:hypothetical protein